MIDGKKLRSFRLRRLVSGPKLAKEMGLSRQRIPQIEAATCTLEVAERYLNGVLRLSGRRERVTLTVAISVPMGGLHADLYAELQEIIS